MAVNTDVSPPASGVTGGVMTVASITQDADTGVLQTFTVALTATPVTLTREAAIEFARKLVFAVGGGIG